MTKKGKTPKIWYFRFAEQRYCCFTALILEKCSCRNGKADYWMQLHKEMRLAVFYTIVCRKTASAGFLYVEQREDFCEHYAVIDEEIVWYGNMNFLGNENVEDNLMRVVSKKIASELMEITFGNTDEKG